MQITLDKNFNEEVCILFGIVPGFSDQIFGLNICIYINEFRHYMCPDNGCIDKYIDKKRFVSYIF